MPVVLVEIERNTDPSSIDAVARFMKGMSSVARCIVVTTEATAAMSLSPDADRREIMWLSDFTEAETREFLQKTKFASNTSTSPLAESEVREVENFVIKQLGCRPSTLHDLITEAANPDYRAWIENRITVEKRKLKSMIKANPDCAKLVSAALEYDEVDGSMMEDLIGMPLQDIAAVAMKKYHVFSYNPVTGTVFFHSKVMYNAAKQWKEEERKKSSWFFF